MPGLAPDAGTISSGFWRAYWQAAWHRAGWAHGRLDIDGDWHGPLLAEGIWNCVVQMPAGRRPGTPRVSPPCAANNGFVEMTAAGRSRRLARRWSPTSC